MLMLITDLDLGSVWFSLSLANKQLCRTALFVLALAVGVCTSFGQPGTPQKNTHSSGCAFEVGQFERTSVTSLELIRLESVLIDPQVSISQTHILQLNTQAGRDVFSAASKSASTHTGPAIGKEAPLRQDDFTGKYLDILVRVLPSKTGETLVDSLLTVTEEQFLRIRPVQSTERQCLQEAVARTLPLVPLDVQSRILFAGEYSLFKSPALTLYLHQLYESIDDRVAVDEDDPTYDRKRIARDYRTRLLKRIYEADPNTGRAIILREIVSDLPRSDIEALKLLPDETLPEMDSEFAHQLPVVYENANWDEYNAKLGVIERYATGAILPAVKSIYLHDPDERNQYHELLFLSYFLRTDPSYGRQLIERSIGMPQSNCSITIFTELAGIRPQPELRDIARRHLDDPNKCVAANAAYSFLYMGSRDVEALLWQDLEAWHKEWANRSEPIPYPEQSYEDSLVVALLFGRGRCVARDTVERLKHLYIKGNSVNGNIGFPQWHDPVRIIVQPHIVESPTFSVDSCSGSLTAEQVIAAIPDFPPGTEFEWHGPSDRVLQSLLEPVRLDVERAVKQHDMSFHAFLGDRSGSSYQVH